MINVFIPHRWNNDDYSTISALLDRTKYKVRDYSVPASSPFDSIDRRYNVDPQIQKQIRYASVVVCSNRPANNNGMSIDEIKYAISIGKPVVAVQVTPSSSTLIVGLGVEVVPCRKDMVCCHDMQRLPTALKMWHLSTIRLNCGRRTLVIRKDFCGCTIPVKRLIMTEMLFAAVGMSRLFGKWKRTIREHGQWYKSGNIRKVGDEICLILYTR